MTRNVAIAITGAWVPPIARCTAHRKHVRDCCIKNTRKRHGSLTTIIGRGQRCEVLNASRALPWRKGAAAATHLGLCNRLWASYISATSRHLGFLHPPAIGNSPAALINQPCSEVCPSSTHPTLLLHGLHRPPSFPSPPGSSVPIDSRSEGSLTSETHPRRRRWTGKNQPTDVDVRPLHNIPQRP